ncbi:MAG: hypothetical protein ACK5PB_02215 [Pirellula sp.]
MDKTETTEPTLSKEMLSEIKQRMEILLGKPLWDSWRILNVQIFDFGKQISHVNKHGQTIANGEISLRVDCSWRITRNASVVVGVNDRRLPDPESSESGDRWTLLEARLEKWLKGSVDLPKIVKGVEVDRFGGVRISLSDLSCLDIFPSTCNGEYWRLLYPESGFERHFIVYGNKLEFSETEN